MRRRAHLRGSEAALREALPVAVRMPISVRFIAERRSRPLRCIEREVMMDPMRAVMCWRGAADRICRPIARRTKACRIRALICKQIARQRAEPIAKGEKGAGAFRGEPLSELTLEEGTNFRPDKCEEAFGQPQPGHSSARLRRW